MNVKKKIFKLLVKNESSKVLHFLLSKFSNNGVILENLRDTDYIFGASPLDKKIINETAQWIDYTPTYEMQRSNKFDTLGCVTFSELNVNEMLIKKQENKEVNFSDRFTVVDSGTTTGGNTMRNVIESVRKNGLVYEDDYSWDKNSATRNEYFTPIPQNIKDKAKQWLLEYEIGYEAITNNIDSMKEALKYSPLWLAGYAWYKQGDKYISYSTNANHCFIVIGYKENDYWIIYDSYEPYIKRLAWNFNFYYPKLIVLKKKEIKFNQEEIDKLRIDRGWDYIVLVEDFLNFKRGVYELLDTGLRKLELNDAANQWITDKKREGKLEGINIKNFNKLLR
uniref:Uncharacterized protein n=1 Tax=viral metagenome TaxID=1070528 RepID=A0A6M3L5A2_9ZZZZ